MAEIESIPFLPSKILTHDDGFLIIGVDGELLNLNEKLERQGEVTRPFPMSIHQAVVKDGVLTATWIDQELMTARMASIALDNLKDGVERGELRERVSIDKARHPEGNIWSHILDSEPLALTSFDEGICFALWRKGIYATKNDASEIWRSAELEWPETAKLPRSQEVVSIYAVDNGLKVWAKGMSNSILDFETGAPISTTYLSQQGVLEQIFVGDDCELLVTNKGDLLWFEGDDLVLQAKSSGPVQHAIWDQDHSSWLIAGWREAIHLSKQGVETAKFKEIPVAHVQAKQGMMTLFNDGSWKSSTL